MLRWSIGLSYVPSFPTVSIPLQMINSIQGEVRCRLLLRPHYGVTYFTRVPDFSKINCRPPQNKSEGVLRKKSISRLRLAVDWLRLFSEKKFVWQKSSGRGFYFKLNFITVTLSSAQVHSDEFILKHLFSPFLKWLQREGGVKNYVWRCEVQLKRLSASGERCIHFHITTNKFIHWKKIRGKWNDLQARHGYCTDSEDPNSTDVHAIINEGKIVSYISKYMTKISTDASAKVYCKVWGCNHVLSNLKMEIREENHTQFWNHLSHYRQKIATTEERIDYITRYEHHLKGNKNLTGLIERQLLNCYENFVDGDDGVRKYKID